jgi:hypothetical protein
MLASYPLAGENPAAILYSRDNCKGCVSSSVLLIPKSLCRLPFTDPLTFSITLGIPCFIENGLYCVNSRQCVMGDTKFASQ